MGRQRVSPPGSLLIKPALSLLRRRPIAGAHWLAVGDAASIYDPLSAQGIHKALLDGATAGATLADRIAGRVAHFDAYAAGVRERFGHYRANRSYLYGLEQRWPDAPFWMRRQEATAAQILD